MVDLRLLVALDPADGEFTWTYWLPGGQIRPLAEGGRFNPNYQVGERFVVLQAAGKWRVLDSQTGSLLHSGPAAKEWLAPPLALEEGRFVFSSDEGQLHLLDAARGSILWTYQPPGRTSLSGVPTFGVGNKRCLLALVSRNIGCELVRLDVGTGAPLWSTPILPGNLPENAVAMDDQRIFLARANKLEARSLGDGKLLWQKHLPTGLAPAACSAHGNGSWQVRRMGEFLLVHPRQASRLPTFWPQPFSWPYMVQFQNDHECAMIVLDPRDGQWVQRLPLARSRGPIQLRVLADRLVVSAGNSVSVFGK